MVRTRDITTAAELLEAGDIGPCELVEGRLIMMTPASFRHGGIVGTIHTLVGGFVRRNRLGIVTSESTGYLVHTDPDTVYCPDVAFVRKTRIGDAADVSFFPGAPDLLIEVLSPTNSRRQIEDKIADCFDTGTVAAWVIDPDTRDAVMHRRARDPIQVSPDGVFADDELLPGFSLRLAELFEGI